MEERKKVIEVRVCKEADCRNTFGITQGEKDYFLNHQPPLALPMRCPKCRIKRRAQNSTYRLPTEQEQL